MAKAKAACHPSKPIVAYGFCIDCFKTWVAKRRPSELHGLTVDQAVDMMVRQGNSCYLCTYEFLLRMPILEHDHFLGQARGWSCKPCNQTIAAANGSASLLRNMADNLEKPPGFMYFVDTGSSD